MDELFEALTLVQTDKIRRFPIILMGRAYWSGLIDWMRQTMLEAGCIDAADLDLIHVCDDPEEVASIITTHYVEISKAQSGERRHVPLQ